MEWYVISYLNLFYCVFNAINHYNYHSHFDVIIVSFDSVKILLQLSLDLWNMLSADHGCLINVIACDKGAAWSTIIVTRLPFVTIIVDHAGSTTASFIISLV